MTEEDDPEEWCRFLAAAMIALNVALLLLMPGTYFWLGMAATFSSGFLFDLTNGVLSYAPVILAGGIFVALLARRVASWVLLGLSALVPLAVVSALVVLWT
jgi:hypothetical protein